MGPKRNISYIKPEEPAFIKRMKEKMGYQEPDTIDTKREIADFDEDTTERDDEKPVVVVLKPGDLTEEDLKAYTEKEDANKKIVFSKPQKKVSDEKNSLDCSSKKKDDLQKKLNEQKGSTKVVKNTSLLSFGEDEDEEC